MKPIESIAIVVSALSSVFAGAAETSDVLHHHSFKAGETIGYYFEDTDTVFQAVKQDGTIQAGDAVQVEEIQIPVQVQIISASDGLQRQITISPQARYRKSEPSSLASTPFQLLTKLSSNVPPSFSYTYKDDSDALSHLQSIFAKIRGDDVGNFLFFKTQDIHQMQDSAAKVPDGMIPGQVEFIPRHEMPGLGGKFIAAPAQIIYSGTATFNGVKAAYIKAISLGHEFILPQFETFTNFSYTMHIALEGPEQGLMLYGEGQETGTIVTPAGDGNFQPQAMVQRQFSIRLQK